MACIPDSGGCERRFTDPFIAHLNSLGGPHYEHRGCLDVKNRTSPEPECLYGDTLSGGTLVVERKAILWPPSYARNHKNDHLVAKQIFAAIASIKFDRLYRLDMPYLIEGKEGQLRDFARSVAETILSRSANLQQDKVLAIRKGAWRFSLTIAERGEVDEGGPDGGVFISYNTRAFDAADDPLDSQNPPPKLVEAVTRIYEACERKFKSYSYARRILLLEPHGFLQGVGSWWLNQIFLTRPPPEVIEEIWAADERLDGDEQGWNFELLFPVPMQIEAGSDAVPFETIETTPKSC